MIEVQIARLEQQQATETAKASATATAQRSLDGAGTKIDLEA